MMKIGEFAEAAGVSVSTQGRMDRHGVLLSRRAAKSKFRRRAEKQAKQFSAGPED